MFSFSIYLQGLVAMLIAVVAVWVLSLSKRDVSIVDSAWSLLFVLGAWAYGAASGGAGGVSDDRRILVLALVGIWALRLAGYITWRNWGHPEDARYQAIRARNQPNFEFKSLYLVFLLQAVLAWLISLPLFGALRSAAPLNGFDAAGAALWLTGFIFEAGGDWQLTRFKANPANKGGVMDRGFWRYTRHPNYFGDFCVWWGFYLIAVGAGAWWSIAGPLIMSLLLMKVSGVTLLEKDIGQRRPKYADYIRRTNAFFPGPPKRCYKSNGRSPPASSSQ
jgi:steroid 5-alpha reductase family enzyme